MAGRIELPHLLKPGMDPDSLVRAIQENFDRITGEVENTEERLDQVWDIASTASDAAENPVVTEENIELEAPISDGSPPASSPTPAVTGGIRWLAIRWDAIANNDPLTYEVHISPIPAFTPDSTTVAGETNGTLAFIRTLPGGAPLAYDIDYYIALRTKDADGVGPPSPTQGPFRLDPAGTDDLLVGSVTAEKLAAVILQATKIFSPYGGPAVAGQYRVEIGDIQVPIRHWDGTLTRFYLDANGNIFVAGRVDFGRSRLTNEDTIDLAEQLPGVSLGELAQSGYPQGSTGTASTTWTLQLPAGATKNNLVLAVIASYGAVDTPAGWTELVSAVNATNGIRLTFLGKVAAGGEVSPSGTFAVASHWRGRAFEISGLGTDIGTLVDQTGTASGLGTEFSVAGALPNANAADLVVASFAFDGLADDAVSSNNQEQPRPLTTGYTDLLGGVGELDPFNPVGYRAGVKNVGVVETSDASSGLAAPEGGGLYNPEEWVGALVTLKRRLVLGRPSSAGTDHVRLYARDRGGVSVLGIVDDANRHYDIGAHVGAQVFKAANQTIPAASNTKVTAAGSPADYDTDGLWDQPNSRFLIPADFPAGKWRIWFYAQWGNNNQAGELRCSFSINSGGAPAAGQHRNDVRRAAANPPLNYTNFVEAIVTLQPLDVIEFWVRQQTGVDVGLAGNGTAIQTSFGLQFLGLT